MTLLDAVAILVVVLALYWGLRRGLVGPLLSELVFVIAVLITARFHGLVAHLVPSVPEYVVTPAMVILISVVIGIFTTPLAASLRRLPIIGPADRSLGAVVHGIFAAVLVYLALGATLDFDRTIYPMLVTGEVTAGQIASLRQVLASNPLTAQQAEDTSLRNAQTAAAIHPLPISVFDQLDQLLRFYLKYVRNPLAESKVMPVVNQLGSRLPIVGRHRPYLAPTPAGAAIIPQ